jgi:hypothetical protein
LEIPKCDEDPKKEIKGRRRIIDENEKNYENVG